MSTLASKVRRVRKKKENVLPETFELGFLRRMDNRSELSKVLRGNYDRIVADLGGEHDISHIKAALIERFVWLEGILQTLEHEMAHGLIEKSEAIPKWIQGVNSLQGLAKVLSVERKVVIRPWATARHVGDNGGIADK